MEETAVIHDEAADMRQFWPITVMTHANELLEWLANAITSQFGIQVAQLWKYQLQSHQQSRPELLALASANVSAPMNLLASSPVATLVELMVGPQNQIIPQPVHNLFPNHLAILLRRRGLTYCAGYCVENDLDLPSEQGHQLIRSKLILFLFLGGPPQGSLVEIRSFLEQTLVLAEKRRLLRIHYGLEPDEKESPVASNNAVDCYNTGNVLFARHCYQDALAAYEQTIRLDPNYVAAYNAKGDTLLQLQRGEEAKEAYKQAVLRSIKRIR
jgi:tetratricopeptide (TPR) repeat protein